MKIEIVCVGELIESHCFSPVSMKLEIFGGFQNCNQRNVNLCTEAIAVKHLLWVRMRTVVRVVQTKHTNLLYTE